ncbi:MAG: DUF4019 domain-containing protein [Sphingomonas adhaesiva]|uniref:helix-turn-helix domain-containing protein n=1 Tax=Sphingomonas adhaesiva TaxID=28212 RepID=UPI002FF4DC39
MRTDANDEAWGLSDKEKDTLRLIVRGHDAKSIARTLDLSVHTVNERLRMARRKMSVSSSREAARLLHDSEGGRALVPQSLGDERIGEARMPRSTDDDGAPVDGAGRGDRRRPFLIGVTLMTIFLAALALVALPPAAPDPAVRTAAVATDPAAEQAARAWLETNDQGRWADSYAATGSAFRKLNTVRQWTIVSQRVRQPLGATISRRLVNAQDLPAPPDGYRVLTFRTRFANKEKDMVETVTLEREGGAWRPVGVTVE